MEPSRTHAPASVIARVLYLCHLIVPAFLIVDILAAMARGRISPNARGQDAVAAISLIWLLGGLGWFLRSRDRAAFLRRITVPLAMVYALYFFALALEVSLRIVGLATPIPGARPPWVYAVTKADPQATPGISGVKKFTVNALGLRGPMPSLDPKIYRIIAIGSSATIGSNLDDSEEWPHLVMEHLNRLPDGKTAWVGNAGLAATTTINHIVLMQWLPGALKVDMAIFMFGSNDMEATLSDEGRPTEHELELAALYKELPPGMHWRTQKIYPYYQRLRFLELGRDIAAVLRQRFTKPPSLPVADLATNRRRRLTGPVVPLPDLSIGLNEYRWRINAVAARCADVRIRCLFLTEPTMWKADATPEEKRLFWLGYTGPFANPKGFISLADMARAMDRYNQTLLGVCREKGLECYDLAANIPKDTRAFFDDVHFNESGARLVAERVADYLRRRPPFVQRAGQ